MKICNDRTQTDNYSVASLETLCAEILYPWWQKRNIFFIIFIEIYISKGFSDHELSQKYLFYMHEKKRKLR